MREMGLRCGIRRETKYHRYNSYKGDVGQSFDNIIGRDFKADGPWQKLGTRRHRVPSSPSVRPTSLRSTTLPAKRSWPTPYRCVPTSPNKKRCSRCSWTPSPQGPSRSCTRTWDGNTSTRPTSVRSPITVSSRACHAKATASTTAPPSRSSGTSRTSSFAARTGRPSRASKPTSRLTSRTGTQQDAK